MSIRRLVSGATLIAFASFWAWSTYAADTYSAAREQMIRLIEQDVRETSIYLEKSALDERILKSLSEVPRHQFVPADVRSRAYDNRPLPIGYGQTISQPYIVAIMTDLIAPRAEHNALEIGTGSGYQAAVLSRLVEKVYTMEIVEPLGKQATERLKHLGFDNIEVSIADGYYGWKEHAPFDIIIVTAAASHIPPPLIEQLKPGGKMIIPVGSRFMTQQLLLVDKNAEKEITVRQILPVRFVPLTGEH
ncbi:MAG: protein-L-isoaspartate(D-aspartate) O-methyltransferase [Candidatus Thiodiazotropha sp. (ex. Lucinisca nassula)]|nr:protein-L-isoaspartate(D-aspartate) O-methyltransferase [Candidatus Thiodiazotropha sp. (ex. Lucinisca nassula)]MBW9274058.1 protein-L-isoaspartate(D-aspartate) O-methyltransferase [Candidatus Thiodiazotropha sp. (ex. Lucinisca nassula)]